MLVYSHFVVLADLAPVGVVPANIVVVPNTACSIVRTVDVTVEYAFVAGGAVGGVCPNGSIESFSIPVQIILNGQDTLAISAADIFFSVSSPDCSTE